MTQTEKQVQFIHLRFDCLHPFVSYSFWLHRAKHETLMKQILFCHKVTKTQNYTSKIPIYRKRKEG